jgi:hypothetical protein
MDLSIPTLANPESFEIGTENVKGVEQFCYLGSMLATTGGAIEDVKVRL